MCTLICPHNQTKETSQCHCKIYFITQTLLLLRERPGGQHGHKCQPESSQTTAGAALSVEGEGMG